MGASLISKLKPSYFNKSLVKDNILIIKRLKCLSKQDTLLNLKLLKKKLNKILHKDKLDYKDIFSQLKCKNKSSVLIISFNDLDNLTNLQNCDLSSLDIVYVDKSFYKLKEIAKYYKDKLKLSLVECCVQDLPFVDEEFDTILNIGSFNRYTNKNKAIKEMLRVSKKGANIIIADSLDKNSLEFFKKLKNAKIDIKEDKYIVTLSR